MRTFLFLLLVVYGLISCSKEERTASVSTSESDVELTNYAPKFVLKNTEDNFYKLEDFRGKIVLLDIWATWCGPCIRQIPALKKLNKEFENTDFQLLSVSIDKEADHEKWRNFVLRNELVGVQLYAGKATPFAADYKATSIPKFVLIGKNGEILTEQLPQPFVPGSEEVNADLIRVIQDALAKS